ncbi:NADH-quinone oxidoreductase subunit I [Coriobacteriia bacterium Es71-Z0120]|uniref:NuoI/complex I 23 kDa subunit family protein n=1 Tax=Parvivirga hydrogeniphila TaxID=2939460 RepID=UPI002260A05E|nr:NADH-quinone oxidoreductase subunit I [Parvivirga hydrogeniphila]MCL4079291.1 NADH-quinone oxidoreductase subunit I [Parvivirga hydrogeniphila]
MWGAGLINGLRITMRNMLRGPITVKYPHEKVELPERARWAVAPRWFEDGSPRCTACMTCVRTCPDHILSLDVETREDKSKHIVRFDYELGACMMCGLCVEACPFDAIEMSHEYELAVTDPAGLRRTLLQDVDAASAAKHREEKAKSEGAVSDEAGDRADG